MGGAAKPTIDHEFIQKWTEERGGWPAAVKGTGGKKDPGIIRIDFPGFSGEGKLERISWEEFFTKFEESNLAFLYQDTLDNTKEKSRFNKLVSRDSVALDDEDAETDEVEEEEDLTEEDEDEDEEDDEEDEEDETEEDEEDRAEE